MLAVIDNFGRKKLMFVGSIGYIASLGVTAWVFYTQSELVPDEQGEAVRQITGPGGMIVFVSLLVFIAAHAFGQGAVIWVFISEIFPNRVRAKGQALCSFTHWMMAAVVSQTFPIAAVMPTIGPGRAFIFFAVCMVAQAVFVWQVLPETKGVTLEQLQKQLGID